jgi:hypothetical protein
MAMAHLKRQGIIELSDQLGADSLSNRILNLALAPFRWVVTLAVPASGISNADGREPMTEADSGIPVGKPSSIGTLLNTVEFNADQIGSILPKPPVPEGRHPFTGEGALYSSGWVVAASDRLEARTDGELESHGEALQPPKKRMRIVSTPKPKEHRGLIVSAEAPAGVNPSVSQRSWRSISDQGGTTEETSTGNDNFSATRAQDDHPVEASETNKAMMAEVNKLESFLGGYLFSGINETRMRYREQAMGMRSFTDTVRLHLAHREGEDFKLEVWLCSSIGKDIAKELGAVKNLTSMLGGFLSKAMKASTWRQGEERKGMSNCTGAVNVSFPNVDDGGDCKMEVMLNFGMGMSVLTDIYPRVG